MILQRPAGIRIGAWLLLTLAGAATGAHALTSPSQDQLKQDIKQELSKNDALKGVEVVVQGQDVTLSGTVATLWAAERAIKKTQRQEGVRTVVSHLTILRAEGDEALAKAVVQAIQRYEYYTLFDYVEGNIDKGVVTLSGLVTPHRDKPAELYARVSRVPGVQDIVNQIEVLSPSIGDQAIRASLAARLFGHPLLGRYSTYVTPPLHIIVQNGYVRLIGVVRDQAEKLVAESIARRTFGVIKVQNELQTRL